jgi:hypothetical protein
MIPFNQLRAGNLFGNSSIYSGDQSLGVNPVRATPDILDTYINRVLPLVQGEENRKANMNQAMLNRMRAQQKQDAIDARANPNVVYNPNVNGIRPIDAANLNLKQEAEQGKNDRAQQSLFSKEAINGANLAEKQSYGQQVNAIRQKTADVAAFKATHPNAQIFAPKGGTVHLFDPAHPELGMQDTGLDAGTLSQEDAAKLGLSNQLQEIAARGDQSRQTDTQRANENITAINARGSQQRQTNQQKQTAVKPQSANDKKVQYYNSAMQLANDPGYSKYIVKGDQANTFSLSPDTPPDLYHQINEKIYGNPTAQDIDLPADNTNSSDQQENDALKTLTNQPADPLGIRQ